MSRDPKPFLVWLAGLDDGDDEGVREALTNWDVADVYRALAESILKARELLVEDK